MKTSAHRPLSNAVKHVSISRDNKKIKQKVRYFWTILCNLEIFQRQLLECAALRQRAIRRELCLTLQVNCFF
jgi:hypothetical protein